MRRPAMVLTVPALIALAACSTAPEPNEPMFLELAAVAMPYLTEDELLTEGQNACDTMDTADESWWDDYALQAPIEYVTLTIAAAQQLCPEHADLVAAD